MQTDSKAVIALVLGVVSMGFVGPIVGVPAMIFGALARRDIDRAGGELAGRGLAAAGIVTGLFGTGLGLVLALSILGAAFTPDSPESNGAMTKARARTDASPVAAGGAITVASGTPSRTCSSGPLETLHYWTGR